MARHSKSNDPLVTGAIGAGALLALAVAALLGWIGYLKRRKASKLEERTPRPGDPSPG